MTIERHQNSLRGGSEREVASVVDRQIEAQRCAQRGGKQAP
jgi:hypothetical protein